jgi:hypothetical protein
MRNHKILPQFLVSLASLLALGCQGDDGFEPRFPVSGKVTYRDEPVAQGTVNFNPMSGGGRACYGIIEDGYYSVTTHTTGDGAVPGNYRVAISAAEINMQEAFTKKKLKGATPTPEEVIRARKKEKSLIPKKYTSTKTSGLTAEVKAESNTFNFELVD